MNITYRQSFNIILVFTNTEDFCRSNDSNEKFMKIMKEFESSRVVEIDKLSRGFLKDRVEVLAKLV